MRRDVLQPREICAQLGFAVEIDVERADVEKRQVEKFGRREIDVGEEILRRRVLGILVQAAKKPLDADTAVPAHDARRDLVAEREHQDGWVIAELSDAGRELAADVALEVTVVEEGDVLRPWQSDHHAQAVACGFVEQLAPRGGVRADGVEAEACHETEVFGDLLRRGKLVAVGVGRKRPVRHAFDEEALVAKAEEFSIGADARR